MSCMFLRVLTATVLAHALLACNSVQFAPQSPASPIFSVVAWSPDPTVITSEDLRQRVDASGLPWKIRHNASGIDFLLVPGGGYNPGAPTNLPDLQRQDRNAVWQARGQSRDPNALADCDRWNDFASLPGSSPTPRPWSVQDSSRSAVPVEPFYLAEREISVGAWKRIMGGQWKPTSEVESEGRDGDSQVWLTQADCRDFCRAAGGGVRLPAEFEWEYAASFAKWFYPDSRAEPAVEPLVFSQASAPKLGEETAPNPLGLVGMIGNAAEICEDSFIEGQLITNRIVSRQDALEAILNSPGYTQNLSQWKLTFEFLEHPVVKGGSFRDPKPLCGPWMRGSSSAGAVRGRYLPDERGFRPAASPSLLDLKSQR